MFSPPVFTGGFGPNFFYPTLFQPNSSFTPLVQSGPVAPGISAPGTFVPGGVSPNPAPVPGLVAGTPLTTFQPVATPSSQILNSGIGIPGEPQLFTRLGAFGGAPFGSTPVNGTTSFAQAARELRYAQNLYAPDHPIRKQLGYLYDGTVYGLRNPDIMDQASVKQARRLLFNSENPFADLDRAENGLPDSDTLNQLASGSSDLLRDSSGLAFTPSEQLDRRGLITPFDNNSFPLQAIGLFPVPPSTSQAPLIGTSLLPFIPGGNPQI